MLQAGPAGPAKSWPPIWVAAEPGRDAGGRPLLALLGKDQDRAVTPIPFKITSTVRATCSLETAGLNMRCKNIAPANDRAAISKSASERISPRSRPRSKSATAASRRGWMIRLWNSRTNRGLRRSSTSRAAIIACPGPRSKIRRLWSIHSIRSVRISPESGGGSHSPRRKPNAATANSSLEAWRR